MSREFVKLFLGNKSSLLKDHVTELTGFFLVKESYQDNGRLSISGDLSNDVNKYYPDLIYNQKPHVLIQRPLWKSYLPQGWKSAYFLL